LKKKPEQLLFIATSANVNTVACCDSRPCLNDHHTTTTTTTMGHAEADVVGCCSSASSSSLCPSLCLSVLFAVLSLR